MENIKFYYENDLVAEWKDGIYITYTDDWLKLPFLQKKEDIKPRDWELLWDDIAFPKSRFNCKEILRAMRIDDIGYDQFIISKLNYGHQASTKLWMQFESLPIVTWEQVLNRSYDYEETLRRVKNGGD